MHWPTFTVERLLVCLLKSYIIMYCSYSTLLCVFIENVTSLIKIHTSVYIGLLNLLSICHMASLTYYVWYRHSFTVEKYICCSSRCLMFCFCRYHAVSRTIPPSPYILVNVDDWIVYFCELRIKKKSFRFNCEITDLSSSSDSIGQCELFPSLGVHRLLTLRNIFSMKLYCGSNLIKLGDDHHLGIQIKMCWITPPSNQQGRQFSRLNCFTLSFRVLL